MLTNVISLLGAALPRRLMEAHKSNPFGHFEPEVIVALHDEVLAAAGSSWFDWRKLPEEWFRSAECARLKQRLIAAFHDDFGDSPFSVLKDPRLCRLIPLWESIFDEINLNRYYVLPYRNPVEVVQSLAHRNGIDPYGGYVLWLRNLLDAEFATRHRQRVFLSYEDLLADPRPMIERLVAGSPIPWPRDVAQVFPEIELAIRPYLRHNQASQDDLMNRAEVPALVHQTYECYQALQRDPANEAIWCRLDAIRADFDLAADCAAATRVTKFMANTGGEQQRERDDKLQLLNFRLREVLAFNPSELNILPADSEVSAANVARLNHQLRQKSARVGYLYAALGYNTDALKRSEAEAAALRSDLSGRSLEIEKLGEELANATADTAVLRSDLSGRALEVDNLRKELANSAADTAALRSDLSGRSLEVENLRKKLANIADDTAVLRSDLSGRFFEIEKLRTELANAAAEIEAVRKSLAASTEENDNLRRALSQSKADAAARGSSLAERSLVIDKLRTELANATAETAALRSDLAERSIEIEKLRTELANWPATLANVRAEIETVRKLFLDSYSWRVTAPLRWLKQRFVRSSHLGHPKGPGPSGP